MYPEQIDIHPSSGRDYRTRRVLKRLANRKRRHTPIEDDEKGGKGYIRCTHGWMY